MNSQEHRCGAGAHPKPTAAELAARLSQAQVGLTKCGLCEWRCGVNRAAGERGRCGLESQTRVFRTELGAAELVAGRLVSRLYLGGCDFACPWCDTAPAAFADDGWVLAGPEHAREFAALADEDLAELEFTGGEPTLHMHTLLALAATSPTPLRLTVNSNMYMTAEVLDLLAGVVTRYLADVKFGNDQCAGRFAGVPRYCQTVRRNLLHAARSAEVVVRHLLMPGHLDCCFYPVANWTAEHLPGARFQLCPGFLPCGRAAADPQLGRLNARADVQAAREHLSQLGLRWSQHPMRPVRLPLGPAGASGTQGQSGEVPAFGEARRS